MSLVVQNQLQILCTLSQVATSARSYIKPTRVDLGDKLTMPSSPKVLTGTLYFRKGRHRTAQLY